MHAHVAYDWLVHLLHLFFVVGDVAPKPQAGYIASCLPNKLNMELDPRSRGQMIINGIWHLFELNQCCFGSCWLQMSSNDLGSFWIFDGFSSKEARFEGRVTSRSLLTWVWPSLMSIVLVREIVKTLCGFHNNLVHKIWERKFYTKLGFLLFISQIYIT